MQNGLKIWEEPEANDKDKQYDSCLIIVYLRKSKTCTFRLKSSESDEKCFDVVDESEDKIDDFDENEDGENDDDKKKVKIRMKLKNQALIWIILMWRL